MSKKTPKTIAKDQNTRGEQRTIPENSSQHSENRKHMPFSNPTRG